MKDEKLKTLKDIEKQDYSTRNEDKGLINAIFFDLKAEAVKWVKRLQKELPDITDLDKGHWTHDDIKEVQIQGQINWINHFFNLTDEDKEQELIV